MMTFEDEAGTGDLQNANAEAIWMLPFAPNGFGDLSSSGLGERPQQTKESAGNGKNVEAISSSTTAEGREKRNEEQTRGEVDRHKRADACHRDLITGAGQHCDNCAKNEIAVVGEESDTHEHAVSHETIAVVPTSSCCEGRGHGRVGTHASKRPPWIQRVLTQLHASTVAAAKSLGSPPVKHLSRKWHSLPNLPNVRYLRRIYSLSSPKSRKSPMCVQAENGPTHTGLLAYAYDFEVEEGTPVVAAREGEVAAVCDCFTEGGLRKELKARANYVVIRHADGLYSRYYHLQPSSALVCKGQRVTAGQRIAASGNTGFSSGPHLHFDVVDVFNLETCLFRLLPPTLCLETNLDPGSHAYQDGDRIESLRADGIDGTVSPIPQSKPNALTAKQPRLDPDAVCPRISKSASAPAPAYTVSTATAAQQPHLSRSSAAAAATAAAMDAERSWTSPSNGNRSQVECEIASMSENACEIDSAAASFSGEFPSRKEPLRARLVLANPLDASTTLINETEIRGSIVLVQRCPNVDFADKVRRGEEAGAAAVVVTNNEDGPVVHTMAPPRTRTPNTSIPALMISRVGAEVVRSAFAASEAQGTHLVAEICSAQHFTGGGRVVGEEGGESSPFASHTRPVRFYWPGHPEGYQPKAGRRVPAQLLSAHRQEALSGQLAAMALD